MVTDIEKEFIDFPLVALRGVVMFPKGILSFEIGRQKSIEALEKSISTGSLIFVAAQKEANLTEPSPTDIYEVGTIIQIVQVLKLPNNSIKVIAEGVSRAKVLEYTQTEPYFRVSGIKIEDNEIEHTLEMESLMRTTKEVFEDYAKALGKILPDPIANILNCETVSELSDLIAINSQLNYKLKQELLEMNNPQERLNKIANFLHKEIEIMKIQSKISAKVRASVDKNQKEYFLKEQIKVINKELGAEDGLQAEVKAYREKMNELELPEVVLSRLEKELGRLSKITMASAETTVSRDYIEWLLDLPWSKVSEETFDLKKCEDILNKEHYGLEEVKERILEFLAVRQKAPKLDAPIICLAGPPGVGKTSIAKSMAKSLNRKYVRVSLGGVRDEAEIRGHRKTYVGSMPGRIINALKQAGTRNPLILLDEIDKMSSDYKGDPGSALLEVLDGEQNQFFRDHYIEIPFDLSDVLFVCTANSMGSIQKALADRLEVIELSSYTKQEKYNIANSFLVKKQLKKHGLRNVNLKFGKGILEDIIQNYTREAGVRQLERLIGKLCRKSIKKMLSEDKKSVLVNESNLEEFLGKRKYRDDKINEKPEVGIVKGLAWTSVGGTTLTIEVNTMKGSGKFELTGNMGDVMKESARAAVSYIRSISDKYNIPKNFYKNTDIHIHIPEGAVPKDGPSAGITMAVAMISALNGVPVHNDIGMTGEITIRGRVLPIGGLKEKVLAAKNAGIKRIIIPLDNKADLEELQDYVKSDLEFYCVSHLSEVLGIAFIKDIKEKNNDNK